MDLLEFQGKSLLASVGVPVPEGRVARTSEEAERAAAELGGPVVVKAQVQVGGRGKAGGIKAAASPAEAEAAAAAKNPAGPTGESVIPEALALRIDVGQRVNRHRQTDDGGNQHHDRRE